jgi:RimJ/RimL family protein N-acetyltransferase
MIELETPRLKLRPFTWDDLDELARISAAPENRRYMWSGPLTREQTAANIRQWLEAYERGLGLMAVTLRPGGELIGQCGLDPAGHEEDGLLGYMIDRPHLGKGLATEAAVAAVSYGFETLGLEGVWAAAMAGNAASRRVMEKLGMSHRRTERREGGEEVFYAVGKEEFFELWPQKKRTPATEEETHSEGKISVAEL